ncbi:LuxR C-terminal-related transcriptional regulator [Streptomyces prunicolor]|nr:LuxR C-terminal-related transcriptional regulator [Streptomyces prunicolor]
MNYRTNDKFPDAECSCVNAITSEELGVLTSREKQVMVGLGNALSSAEIAGQLNIAEYTTKKYIASIFAKLRLRSRTEACIVARTRHAEICQHQIQGGGTLN